MDEFKHSETFRLHKEGVSSIAFDPVQGILATALSSGVLQLFGCNEFWATITHYRLRSASRQLLFHPGQGRLVSIYEDNKVAVWNTRSSAIYRETVVTKENESEFGTVVSIVENAPFSLYLTIRFYPQPFDFIPVISTKNSMHFFNVSQCRFLDEEPVTIDSESPVVSVEHFPSDPKLLFILCSNGSCMTFSLSTRRTERRGEVKRGSVFSSFCFDFKSSDVFCLSKNGFISVFDTDTFREKREISISGDFDHIAVTNRFLFLYGRKGAAVAEDDKVARRMDGSITDIACLSDSPWHNGYSNVEHAVAVLADGTVSLLSLCSPMNPVQYLMHLQLAFHQLRGTVQVFEGRDMDDFLSDIYSCYPEEQAEGSRLVGGRVFGQTEPFVLLLTLCSTETILFFKRENELKCVYELSLKRLLSGQGIRRVEVFASCRTVFTQAGNSIFIHWLDFREGEQEGVVAQQLVTENEHFSVYSLHDPFCQVGLQPKLRIETKRELTHFRYLGNSLLLLQCPELHLFNLSDNSHSVLTEADLFSLGSSTGPLLFCKREKKISLVDTDTAVDEKSELILVEREAEEEDYSPGDNPFKPSRETNSSSLHFTAKERTITFFEETKKVASVKTKEQILSLRRIRDQNLLAAVTRRNIHLFSLPQLKLEKTLALSEGIENAVFISDMHFISESGGSLCLHSLSEQSTDISTLISPPFKNSIDVPQEPVGGGWFKSLMGQNREKQTKEINLRYMAEDPIFRQTKEKMNERGEKLSELQENTEELKENAASFRDTAKAVREKLEKSWF